MSSEAALVVSAADPTPPYEQLRRQLADLIGSGALRPGDRLPPLRQLAADLGLAVGTVARTYRELEAAGIVVSRRGAGTRVAVASKQRSETDRRQALREQAQLFLRRARLLGASNEETCAAFEHALKEPRSPTAAAEATGPMSPASVTDPVAGAPDGMWPYTGTVTSVGRHHDQSSKRTH